LNEAAPVHIAARRRGRGVAARGACAAAGEAGYIEGRNVTIEYRWAIPLLLSGRADELIE
jgi:hypothetical protein